MSETIDDFRAMRADALQRSKLKRQSNRENAPKVLRRDEIPFTTHNDGAHLVVRDRWDFWPGTGKFIDRQTKKAGRGVYNLVRIVKENP